MTTIRHDDLVESVAAALQYISYYHPVDYIRNLAAGTDEQHPDGQGRITLSADHRSYAGLSKECVVFGSFDHLEIWDAAAWRDYQSQHEENFSAANSASLNAVL